MNRRLRVTEREPAAGAGSGAAFHCSQGAVGRGGWVGLGVGGVWWVGEVG